MTELLNVYIVCDTKQGYTSIQDLENGSVSLPENLEKESCGQEVA